MKTAKMLDLSTACVPPAPYCHFGKPACHFGNHRMVEYEYGWIVFVPGGTPPGMGARKDEPAWLTPIMEAALKEDCILINFDRDSSGGSEFPQYDW